MFRDGVGVRVRDVEGAGDMRMEVVKVVLSRDHFKEDM